MKKFLLLSILTYLLFTLNTNASSENSNEIIKTDNKILKIGVLVPLSGEFKQIGNSVLKAVQLATVKLNDSNIKIYDRIQVTYISKIQKVVCMGFRKWVVQNKVVSSVDQGFDLGHLTQLGWDQTGFQIHQNNIILDFHFAETSDFSASVPALFWENQQK